MLICDLIKNQDTYPAELGHTVLQTVCAMVERNIGAVPVVHNGKLVGIFSERDLMRRVVAESRDPRSTCLAEVMTDDPLTIARTTTSKPAWLSCAATVSVICPSATRGTWWAWFRCATSCCTT